MQDCEARELRRRAARLKRDRPGFRFSAALRAEISAWVVERRERGVWWCDLSRAIGVSPRDAEALGCTAREHGGDDAARRSDRHAAAGDRDDRVADGAADRGRGDR